MNLRPFLFTFIMGFMMVATATGAAAAAASLDQNEGTDSSSMDHQMEEDDINSDLLRPAVTVDDKDEDDQESTTWEDDVDDGGMDDESTSINPLRSHHSNKGHRCHRRCGKGKVCRTRCSSKCVKRKARAEGDIGQACRTGDACNGPDLICLAKVCRAYCDDKDGNGCVKDGTQCPKGTTECDSAADADAPATASAGNPCKEECKRDVEACKMVTGTGDELVKFDSANATNGGCVFTS